MDDEQRTPRQRKRDNVCSSRTAEAVCILLYKCALGLFCIIEWKKDEPKIILHSSSKDRITADKVIQRKGAQFSVGLCLILTGLSVYSSITIIAWQKKP